MKVNTDSKKIEDVISSRYIERIYPSKEILKKILKSGKRLRIYLGIDPTAPKLHLGHSTNFFLLKEFQELGHQIIFLIGDFTAQIGDPTGRLGARKALSKEEVLQNCKDYKSQTKKILDFKSKKNPARMEFNSKWYNKLTFKETFDLLSRTTVGQIIKRNMFQRRIKEKKEIHLHEFLYPLLQGYDSVVLNADIEVGGNDQTFNMLMGRDLVKEYQNRKKIVITTKLLINPKTGKKLMSKSEGNFIALNDLSKEMYGKIMALPDEVIFPCFELCTEVPLKEMKGNKKALKDKTLNPRDVKAKLAKKIVAIYHNEKEAEKAEKEFERVFRKKKLPSDLSKVSIKEKQLNILDLLTRMKLTSSKSEAKRLIFQKGVKIDGQVQKDWQKSIKIKKRMVIQVGKRKFAKII